MKLYQKILIGLGLLIALPFIVALFVKNEFLIEREVLINKPKQEVFDYVKLIKNQEKYTVWTKADPNVKIEYTGTDGTIGFVSSWSSTVDDVGVGKQQITNVVEGERVDVHITFVKPFAGESDAYTKTVAVSATQTKVINGFSGKNPYPFNLMCLFMNADFMVGGMIQQNLDNLKKELEK